MSGEGKVVCVTGASGYIASWLVKLLLEHGYTVQATVRNPDDPKIKHLHEFDGAKERLQLFKANLLEEGSFDSAVDGCVGVFHTASPVLMTANDPQAELIDPAMKGTLNVLRSCVKVQSVKRVVVTSSLASVIYNGKPLNPNVVVDETWFSDPAFCKESNNWYPLSKTLAEEAALRFAKENGIDLVTLLPGVVIGPILQSTLNFSVEVIFNIINGSQIFPSPYRLVDVRDVAFAHIQALEVPTANGRYLLVGRVTHLAEILKILHENYPSFNLLEKFKAVKDGPSFQVSKERAKSLGINFRPVEVSLQDTVESLKEKGFLQF
ncbi:cinnamoyl-CoA reductase 1-like [Pistacia vera]|uniref:cinnamoyl-CoA reductase 1-like n=1 Tax=Pistacia vera TaxID=55513 RepID=UPI0012630E3E|nr:cinnamoyl-CoA reductase 1-like [Pistacia vera]